MTSTPSSSSDSVRCEPMNPAHPVTNTRVSASAITFAPWPHPPVDSTTGGVVDSAARRRVRSGGGVHSVQVAVTPGGLGERVAGADSLAAGGANPPAQVRFVDQPVHDTHQPGVIPAHEARLPRDDVFEQATPIAEDDAGHTGGHRLHGGVAEGLHSRRGQAE